DPVFGKLRTDHGGITDYIYFSVYFVHFPPEAVRTGNCSWRSERITGGLHETDRKGYKIAGNLGDSAKTL
ncbi:hypothetical protein, partial [Bittarella massiliensis (ex Durand et al. 2017)]|uniref:hypothetical protein n=1 Tax=Bittarella massiliensis (ex Durand et al. 2017) TaxID=1720313 RepID=UPI001AA0E618